MLTVYFIFFHRLFQNFTTSIGDQIACKEVFEQYEREFGDASGAKAIPLTIGSLVAKLFPDVDRKQKRAQVSDRRSSRIYVYNNLSVRNQAQCTELQFEELPNFLMQQGYYVFRDNESVYCTELSPNNTNGTDPIKQLIFHQDLSIRVQIGRYNVNLHKLLIPTTYKLTDIAISSILKSFRLFNICHGFTFDHTQRRSDNCFILINPLSSSHRCKSCKYKAQRERSKKTTPDDGQSNEDILVDELSGSDLKDIIQNLNQGMASNDQFMELMSSQLMAYKCKDKRNHRWSPR